MGQEIEQDQFSAEDFDEFSRRLRRETHLLCEWLEREKLSEGELTAGFELEAWLVDSNGLPAPVNDAFLKRVDNPLVVPELASFNVELNGTPQSLGSGALTRLFNELLGTWSACQQAAQNLQAQLLMIGTLPTVRPEDFSLQNMSAMQRYRAINEQAMRMRGGRPFELCIDGITDHYRALRHDVMLEAATTSFQIHLQVSPHHAARYYNAARIVSAPMVGISANSPFLFGNDLWAETRIPVFEQTVDLSVAGAAKRVSFGHAYVNSSLAESFLRNERQFPVLLPTLLQEPETLLPHLRMHNGTIWRWNRPLIGFDPDGTPHLRIEHRVLPAGPSAADMIANAAFFFGLLRALAAEEHRPETRLAFAAAESNFYAAARDGMQARVIWLDGHEWTISALVRERLLDLAAKGLQMLGIGADETRCFLSVITERVSKGMNGATWQRAFVARYGKDWRGLTQTYLEHQESGAPAHRWPLPSVQVPASRRLQLVEMEELPKGFQEIRAVDLHHICPTPTLIHLQGRRDPPLFVSILLHGNEDTGLLAVQELLRRHSGPQELPRSISLFVGNVEAARMGMRRLDNQPDYNRVWPGTPAEASPERELMAKVYRSMARRGVFASVDLHNNTGLNPHYACINRLEESFLHLAALFGRTVVYFTRPRGVQSAAFANLCPAVTLECGKVGQLAGVSHAAGFLDACLHLQEFPEHALSSHDIDLYHTVATVRIPNDRSIGHAGDGTDFSIDRDLDRLNFRELPPGTQMATLEADKAVRLDVRNEQGDDVGDDYFDYTGGEIRTRTAVMPSMLTLDLEVIRKDCLCYLMERINPIDFREQHPAQG